MHIKTSTQLAWWYILKIVSVFGTAKMGRSLEVRGSKLT